MMRIFVWPPEEGADLPEQYVGVVIQWLPQGWLHAGVLFRAPAQEAQVLDQFGHLVYRLEPPLEGQLCVVCAVDEVFVPTVIEAFRRLWQRNEATKIPYGYSSPAQAWFSPRGVLQKDASKVGLCCQTFVQAAYLYANQPLIDPPTPPVRADDAGWQQEFIDGIQRVLTHHEQRAHFARVQAQVGANLYRPLEIAGAALADELPCAFLDAQTNGETLRRLVPPSMVVGAVLVYAEPNPEDLVPP